MAYSMKYAVVALVLALPTRPATAVTINFDNLSVGTRLSNQIAGVQFIANAFSGPGSSSSHAAWATNTDLTVVSSTGNDVGALGTPALVSGNVLRSFSGWLDEDGDPSFSIYFNSAINSISVTFAGVATPADTRIFVYNGSTLLSTIAGTVTTGQFALSFAAPSITRVVVAPGSNTDWVAVDNIQYQLASAAVPEPTTWAMLMLGFGTIGYAVRRKTVVEMRIQAG